MSNVPTSQLQNAANNAASSGLFGAVGVSSGMSSQQMQMAMLQSDMARQYQAAVTGSPFRAAGRLHLEVDVVSNGFVLAVGSERLIAKDIEELQQHFVAQVANMLLEKSK